jgi:prevent-host-death family protein
MVARTIPQRELRNNIGEILREAEAGTEFTITVRGRPVATLGPPVESKRRRVNVPADALRTKLAETPVDDDFAADIARVRELEPPIEDPWPNE